MGRRFGSPRRRAVRGREVTLSPSVSRDVTLVAYGGVQVGLAVSWADCVEWRCADCPRIGRGDGDVGQVADRLVLHWRIQHDRRPATAVA